MVNLEACDSSGQDFKFTIDRREKSSFFKRRSNSVLSEEIKRRSVVVGPEQLNNPNIQSDEGCHVASDSSDTSSEDAEAIRAL